MKELVMKWKSIGKGVAVFGGGIFGGKAEADQASIRFTAGAEVSWVIEV